MKTSLIFLLLYISLKFAVGVNYTFVPRILENGHILVKSDGVAEYKSCRKVFVTLVVDGFTFRRKAFNKKRVAGTSSRFDFYTYET